MAAYIRPGDNWRKRKLSSEQFKKRKPFLIYLNRAWSIARSPFQLAKGAAREYASKGGGKEGSPYATTQRLQDSSLMSPKNFCVCFLIACRSRTTSLHMTPERVFSELFWIWLFQTVGEGCSWRPTNPPLCGMRAWLICHLKYYISMQWQDALP